MICGNIVTANSWPYTVSLQDRKKNCVWMNMPTQGEEWIHQTNHLRVCGNTVYMGLDYPSELHILRRRPLYLARQVQCTSVNSTGIRLEPVRRLNRCCFVSQVDWHLLNVHCQCLNVNTVFIQCFYWASGSCSLTGDTKASALRKFTDLKSGCWFELNTFVWRVEITVDKGVHMCDSMTPLTVTLWLYTLTSEQRRVIIDVRRDIG